MDLWKHGDKGQKAGKKLYQSPQKVTSGCRSGCGCRGRCGSAGSGGAAPDVLISSAGAYRPSDGSNVLALEPTPTWESRWTPGLLGFEKDSHTGNSESMKLWCPVIVVGNHLRSWDCPTQPPSCSWPCMATSIQVISSIDQVSWLISDIYICWSVSLHRTKIYWFLNA